MRRSYLPPLLLLSAIWGSSYMFIKVEVRDFSPAAMVEVSQASVSLPASIKTVEGGPWLLWQYSASSEPVSRSSS